MMNTQQLARILIVEDERITASAIEKCLADSGYEVVGIAPSGKEALEKTAQTRPDLVLMDIRLQGLMDGISVAQRIQALFGIPVVYLTAHSDGETLKRVVHSKPYGFITKPFAEEELSQTIKLALERHQTARGTS